MLVYNKIFVLLYFIFTGSVFVHSASSTRTNNTDADLNRFLEVIRSFGIASVTAGGLLLNPSSYWDYQSGLKNEDLHLNATQLIKKYGFPVETHRVTTKDGYILTLFRIPCGGPPVFLLHGLELSADDFIIAGPKSGMAYLLARDGYDVWLGNVRGNKYSRMHETLNPDKDSAYWNFSVSEIGEIDTPTMVDYILNTTGYTQLTFIGHSQGTRAFLLMCSVYPEYNNKISLMIAMAIVGYVSNMKSPAFRAFSYFVDEQYFLYKHLGFPNELLPSNEFTRAVSGVVCGVGGLVVATTVCNNIAFLFLGYDYSLLNVTNIPNIAQHAPAGSSTKQFLHYCQEVNSGNVQKFDYGQKKNIEVYGTKTPPLYHLEMVNAPVVILYSDNDWLVDVIDANRTRSVLPNVLDFYRIPYERFNHLDYLWGLHSKKLVYNKISEMLTRYGSRSDVTTCSKI